MRRCQEAACAWPREQVWSRCLEPSGGSCWPRRLEGRADLDSRAIQGQSRGCASRVHPGCPPPSWSGLLCWYGGLRRVGECLFFLQRAFSVAQSCPTLCDPTDCSPPGFSAYGIFQARILEWVASSSSRGSSRPKDQICVSYVLTHRFFTTSTT